MKTPIMAPTLRQYEFHLRENHLNPKEYFYLGTNSGDAYNRMRGIRGGEFIFIDGPYPRHFEIGDLLALAQYSEMNIIKI